MFFHHTNCLGFDFVPDSSDKWVFSVDRRTEPNVSTPIARFTSRLECIGIPH